MRISYDFNRDEIEAIRERRKFQSAAEIAAVFGTTAKARLDERAARLRAVA